jgi:hypothetical protein
MKRTFIRIVDNKEVDISTQMDFLDDDGNRHPRNVIWLWDEESLWDRLNIRVTWVNEPSDILEFATEYPIIEEKPAPKKKTRKRK